MPTSLSAPPEPQPAARSRLRGLAATTPGRLRLLMALVVAMALLAGALGTLAIGQAADGTSRIATETEPLLVSAEGIYTSIADADATAAQAFLSGGLEPTPLVQRYQADLVRAGEQLAKAGSLSGTGGPAAEAVRRLDVMLPRYTGLIQAARANNRQNNPVGVAYLLTASELARGVPASAGDPGKDGLLLAAHDLFAAAQQRLADDYATARALGMLAFAALGTAVLLAVLGYTQLYLLQRTRRIVNPGLAGAMLLVLVATVAGVVLLLVQHDRLDRARTAGSDLVVRTAQARIALLTQRGAESRTLAAHEGGGGDSERRFAEQTSVLLGTADAPGLLAGTPAESAERAYLEVHKQVRARDDAVDYRGAVSIALGAGSTAFAAVDQALADQAAQAQDAFGGNAERAANGLTALGWAVPVLALLTGVLSVLGLNARLREYR